MFYVVFLLFFVIIVRSVNVNYYNVINVIETLGVSAVGLRLTIALLGQLMVGHVLHRPRSDDSADLVAPTTVVLCCRSIAFDKFIRVGWIQVATGSTIRMEPWPPSDIPDA